MDYPSSIWDVSLPGLPQQLAPIDDSDFLSILSKQLNPTAATLQPNLAPQQTLTTDLSPPFSEDSSSPSPPAAPNKGLGTSTSTGEPAKRDDMRKRTIQQAISDDEDDDIEGQPQAKSQKEQPAKKGTKRKSIGNGDENRAQKRKEQNRAAQRAFRERKEKHVKDLEEQVAALEAKNQTQASENENLRELLGRLQNENLMLKQSAFTFNMSAHTPRSTSANVTTTRPTPSSSSPSISLNPANKAGSTPASSGLVSTPTDSPDANHPLGLSTGSGYTPLLSFNNPTNSSTTSLTNLTSMMSTDNSSPLTLLPSPSGNATGPSPYTTIASNPMFTSFTDFSAWDQFFADSNLDMTLAGITQPGGPSPPLPGGSSVNTNAQAGPSKTTGNMEDLFQTTGNFAEMMPFSGFSPLGGTAMNMSASNSPIEHRSTPPSVLMNTAPTPSAFTLESRESRPERSMGLKPRTSSPCGGADPDEAALPGSAHHNPNHPKLADVGMQSASNPLMHPHMPDECPKSKEDVERMIQSQPISTFGTLPGVAPNPNYSPEKQIRLKEVWATLKNHPRFEECDMDELCRELSAKVKCDGSMPVIDASEKPCEELSKIIDNLQAVKKAEVEIKAQVASTPRVSPEAAQQQAKLLSGSQLPGPSPEAQAQATLFNPYQSFLPFALNNTAASSSGGSGQPSRPQVTTQQTSGSDASSPTIQTPAQPSASGDATMSLGDPTAGMGLESWMNLDLSTMGGPIPEGLMSPGTQFLAYLNGTTGTGDFSPSAYLNLGGGAGDKE